MILVGPGAWFHRLDSARLLGAAAYVLAIVNWFVILLVLPHVVIRFVLVLGWTVATFIAWLAILFTGRYPASLQEFGIGVMRWLLRVEAYLLLLIDEFPPFALD